jgi:hypothetical protein
MDPTEVAARNAGEFFIDRIYEHSGKTQKAHNHGISSILERLLSKE